MSIWCFPSTGLVVGVMVQHFGPRNCGVLGAVLFSMSLVLSAFVTSIGYLIVSFGIISGKFFYHFSHYDKGNLKFYFLQYGVSILYSES